MSYSASNTSILMPQDDQQRLADLLKAMSEGRYTESDTAGHGEQASHRHTDEATAAPAGPPAVIPPRPRPTAVPPKPARPEPLAPAARLARPTAPPEVKIVLPPEAPQPEPPSLEAQLVSKRRVSERVAPKQHLVQTHYFKQTVIPVLLTAGILCLVLVGLGRFSDATSPFAAFGQPMFAIPVGIIGLLMLGLAVLTMLQVRGR